MYLDNSRLNVKFRNSCLARNVEVPICFAKIIEMGDKETLTDDVPAGRCHGHLDLLHHLVHPLLHPPGLSPDAGQGSAVGVVDVFQTLSLTFLPVSGFDDDSF